MSGGSLSRRGAALPVEAEGDELVGPEEVQEFLGFTLSEEAYALPLSSVREILKPPPVTEVPRATKDVLGIISVRGRIITVIDLRRLIGVPETSVGRPARVLLVDGGAEVLGLLVDRVLSVFRLTTSEIEIHPSVGGDTAEYVMGIGRPRTARSAHRGRAAADQRPAVEMLILLDPAPLLKR